MALTGFISLVVAFAATVLSVGALCIARLIDSSAKTVDRHTRERYRLLEGRVSLVGYLGVLLTTLAVSLGCAILIYCFLVGDPSLEYVVKNQSSSTGPLSGLFKVAGLWGGREGSLLFWAWLISLFAAVVTIRGLKRREQLDSMALLVVQLVMLAFVAVLLFSQENMPFAPLDYRYFDAVGNLKSFDTLLLESSSSDSAAVAAAGLEPLNAGLVLGMNILLEHWAMAIHPPTLFIGYAGLTLPFAYAIAALILGDSSKTWVIRAQRYTLFSWLLLGIGIGLGAIWAYVVLGWGGYWGWDPVENASLLSWILAVALVHSFTVYRQQGAFKRWSVMCACLTFAFVIIGTFISRSGVVQNSVHAFNGDQVSLVLFLALILVSVLAGIVGLLFNWSRFSADKEPDDQNDALLTKDVAYYFNNVILVVSAIVITALTLSSALPEWLPLIGGKVVATSTFNAIARPLGIIYCLIMAVCPMLSWAKTDIRAFLKRAIIPGIGALVVFGLLLFYFIIYLAPSHYATLAAGGTPAAKILEAGPTFYYFSLTLLGFLVAALLFFNSLFMLGRTIGQQARRDFAKRRSVSGGAVSGGKPVESSKPVEDEPNVGDYIGAFFPAIIRRPSAFGGFLSHLSIAVILVGLIGSSMYVTEKSDYLPIDLENDTVAKEFVIQDYRLRYASNNIVDESEQSDGSSLSYTVTFDAYKGDNYLGQITPGIFKVEATGQQKALAGVLSDPLQDLFVVYNGVGNLAGHGQSDIPALSVTAWINPFVSFVWVGFGLLMLGTLIATIGNRRVKAAKPKADGSGPAVVDESEAGLQAEDESEVALQAENEPKSELDSKLARNGDSAEEGDSDEVKPAEDGEPAEAKPGSKQKRVKRK